MSLTAFGQQPLSARTAADFLYSGPVITGGRPAPLDRQFSTDGGDRALLSGAFFAPPDVRSLLGTAASPTSFGAALAFPLALPLPAGGALPTCALRINFGRRCVTGASDAAGLVPRSVADCSASARVTALLAPSPYAGVGFLQTNADDPAGAATLLNVTANASIAVGLLGAPFLSVAASPSASDTLVFETPPGVGVNLSVSLSVLDFAGRELWRSNSVRRWGPLAMGGGTSRLYPPLCPPRRSTSPTTPPGIILTQPSPLFVSAPGGAAAAGVAVTTASSFALTLQCKNVGRLADAVADEAVSVVVGGIVCAAAQRVVLRGVNALQCSLPATAVVGYKNVTVTVAGQTAFVPPTDPRTVLVVCAPGSFGRTGEACAPCPAGATCAGYLANAGADLRAAAANGSAPPFFVGGVEVAAAGLHTYPTPITGWFNLNGTSAYGRWGSGVEAVDARLCTIILRSGVRLPARSGIPRPRRLRRAVHPRRGLHWREHLCAWLRFAGAALPLRLLREGLLPEQRRMRALPDEPCRPRRRLCPRRDRWCGCGVLC